MTQFQKKRFHITTEVKAPADCNHGWDGKKFWLTPKGACVKCGAKNVEAFAYLGIDKP